MAIIREESWKFKVSGIDVGRLPCFICGHARFSGVQDQLMGEIDPKFGEYDYTPWGVPKLISHPVAQLIESHGFLSNVGKGIAERLVVRMCACAEHEPNLSLLFRLTMENHQITSTMLKLVTPGRKLP